jgi:hypothetical protein
MLILDSTLIPPISLFLILKNKQQGFPIRKYSSSLCGRSFQVFHQLLNFLLLYSPLLNFLIRSATIVLAYLMKHHKMKFIEALKYVNTRRSVYPNSGFEKQLKKYEVELQLV